MALLLIIVVILLVAGGGGYYGFQSGPAWGFGGMLVPVLLILLLAKLLGAI